MITVMKASAGSGKTHALASRYVGMLLASKDPDEYRHILAVTFTNKATDEMKRRIIEELFRDGSPKAERILSDILHDYGSFAVSTIDRFFQQTLRAFARELGQFKGYQVELDKNALVDEAVDTILDELDAGNGDDRKMVRFIVENMEDRLSEGGSLNVEDGLKEMARQLKSETFSRKMAALGFDPGEAYSAAALSDLKKTCSGIVRAFEKKVRDRAEAIVAASEGAGFQYEDYNRKWLSFIEKFRKWKRKDNDRVTDAVRLKITSPAPENWFAKANRGKFDAAYNAVGGLLEQFLALWSSDEYRWFVTATMLLEQVYGLGVAERLFRTFERVARDRNVVCLDESDRLLRDIIDGSDTPFVYEKTGVRFHTFLLDEFQDTSVTQWENFLPLLKESESGKGSCGAPGNHRFDNLIVGDVKQSIYRWRESDWGLLDHEVAAAFPGGIYDDPLGKNWRSLSQIVGFNNGLYPALASAIDGINPVPEGCRSVSGIYDSCHQDLGKPEEQQGGSVDVEFVDGGQAQLQCILETVGNLVADHGASYGDIAILVRRKSAGTAIAQALIESGIPVVTDASLRLKNSVTVRRLVSMMSFVDNPDDNVGGYVARSCGLAGVPYSWHSLPDLAETLYRALRADPSCREDCSGEVMYVLSFMDFINDYSRTEGNNLHEFLAFWEGKDPDVNADANSAAVRIMTIHKSKGLSFPFVIVPYVEQISLYDPLKTRVWAVPEKGCGELDPFCDRLFHIPLNEKAADSLFRETYVRERFNQGVDAINLLYVATTRAKKGMKIIADTGARNAAGSMAGLLKACCGDGNLHLGETADFSTVAGNVAEAASCELSYPYYSIEQRLAIRPYAAEFFTDEDKGFTALGRRERGIVLHDILSRVLTLSDLPSAVDDAVLEGSLDPASRGIVLSFLEENIASHPEFFPGDGGVEVLRETSVIDADGCEHKPDRVLIYPDGKVVIVDYKFSGMDHDEYIGQIERYRNVFKAMGYAGVEACLWFVYQKSVKFAV